MKVLADRKHKLTILTSKPADEKAPTAAELNAGIEACLKIATDNFAHRPTASDTVDTTMLCGSKESGYTNANFEQFMRVVRQFLTEGGIDPDEDELFTALKVRGTTLWAYGRKTDKDALELWGAGDEIYLGTRFTPDHGSVPTDSAWISADFPCAVQDGWPFIKVAAA